MDCVIHIGPAYTTSNASNGDLDHIDDVKVISIGRFVY